MREAFDVIVGAGSAECVPASRLSRDGRHRVLLIEAGGGDRNPIFRLPILPRAACWYQRSNWGHADVLPCLIRSEDAPPTARNIDSDAAMDAWVRTEGV